ncbi:hypothetical protein H4R33_003123 [Dimargaris cristalligena]|nr:hypothetical protein H4R33_003123 [Dimargaris cristalligena]
MDKPPKTTKALPPQHRIGILQEQLKKASVHLRNVTEENEQLAQKVDALQTEHQKVQTEKDELRDQVQWLQAQIANMEARAPPAPAAPDATSVPDPDAAAEPSTSTATSAELEAEMGEVRQLVTELASSLQSISLEGDGPTEPVLESTDIGDQLVGIKRQVAHLIKQHEDGQQSTHSFDEAIDVTMLELLQSQVVKLNEDLVDTRTQLLAQFQKGLTYVSQPLQPDGSKDEPSTEWATDLDPDLTQAIKQLRSDWTSRLESQVGELNRTQDALATLQTQHDGLADAKASLEEEYQTLLGKLGTMKDVLAAKLQNENRDLTQVRSALEEARQRETNLQKQLTDLQSDYSGLQETLAMARAERLSREKHADEAEQAAQLRYQDYERQLADHSSELRQVQLALEQKHRDYQLLETAIGELRHEHDSVQDRLDHQEQECRRLADAELIWGNEKAAYEKSIENLQGALRDLQDEKEEEHEAAMGVLRLEIQEAERQLKIYKSRTKASEKFLERTQAELKTLRSMKQDYENLTELVGKLKHEVAIQREDLADSMKKIRELNVQDNVDRRVITNLIVTFLELPYGDTKRFEVLQLMSNILKFTSEQQEQVGLIRKSLKADPNQDEHGPTDELSGIQIQPN